MCLLAAETLSSSAMFARVLKNILAKVEERKLVECVDTHAHVIKVEDQTSYSCILEFPLMASSLRSYLCISAQVARGRRGVGVGGDGSHTWSTCRRRRRPRRPPARLLGERETTHARNVLKLSGK